MSETLAKYLLALDVESDPTVDAVYLAVINPDSATPSVAKIPKSASAQARTLSILASIPPFSGRDAAALEVVESTDGGTDKPLIAQLRFDDTTIEARQWVLDASALVGTAVLRVGYRMAGANTDKDVVLVAKLAAVGSTDASMNAKAFGSANSVTERVPNAANTAGEAEITLTNADSLAQGDWLNVLLYRNASDGADNAAGDLIVTFVRLEWSS